MFITVFISGHRIAWGQRRVLPCLVVALLLIGTSPARAEPLNPILGAVFPPGGSAGTTVDLTVTVTGTAINPTDKLLCNHPGIEFENLGRGKYLAKIAPSVFPGAYELRAFGRNGLSSPRTFTVGARPEILETEDVSNRTRPVSLNSVINGRIAKGGDVDAFRFSAKRGQRVVMECRAERIDSQLRAVLELYDSRGRRVAVNRGYFGIDPVIAYRIPADGDYTIKTFDLVFSGSADHFYRLSIDTGPRVVFAMPSVLQRGRKTKVSLFGWNLRQTSSGVKDDDAFERVEVEIQPPDKPTVLPFRRLPSQVVVDGFAYHHPGSQTPLLLGITDVPTVRERNANRSPQTAPLVNVPCEINGQLSAGDERDWYAINAKRGEVFWMEAYGERIDSPVDLDVAVLDSTAAKVLAQFRDEIRNVGGKRLPTNHADPAGRWVAPADGRYLVMIRNMTGGLKTDPRRVYRLSLRREEPDFRLVVVPRTDQPSSLNVPRGGRVIADVVVFRRRGLNGAIRVSAKNLPTGISCPDVWLGPGVNRTPLVISADQNAPAFVGVLQLHGSHKQIGQRRVSGSSIVRAGTPIGSSRLTTGIALAIAGTAPLRITADGHETRTHNLFGKLKIRYSPGGILDVAVHIDRGANSQPAVVELIGVGLPPLMRNQTATIPAAKKKGHLCFSLPSTLPTGTYTIAIQAKTTVANANKKGTRSVTVFSNPVTFEVKPAAFVVRTDPYVPTKIRRGEVVQIKYSAKRINGFIGKIHTELAAPEKVIGVRGRGVTFVGQTESGGIQVIANDDAPLGRQRFLRLFSVGVVEDEPVFHGSCFLYLEIVK